VGSNIFLKQGANKGKVPLLNFIPCHEDASLA